MHVIIIKIHEGGKQNEILYIASVNDLSIDFFLKINHILPDGNMASEKMKSLLVRTLTIYVTYR